MLNYSFIKWCFAWRSFHLWGVPAPQYRQRSVYWLEMVITLRLLACSLISFVLLFARVTEPTGCVCRAMSVIWEQSCKWITCMRHLNSCVTAGGCSTWEATAGFSGDSPSVPAGRADLRCIPLRRCCVHSQPDSRRPWSPATASSVQTTRSFKILESVHLMFYWLGRVSMARLSITFRNGSFFLWILARTLLE